MRKQHDALSSESLSTSYHATLAQIQDVTERANRTLDDITLIAVTKNQPIEAIERLYELGHRDFGENRVEEASKKIASISAKVQ